MRASSSLGLTLFTTTLFLACDSPSGPGSGQIPETAVPAPATEGYDITTVPKSRVARPPRYGLSRSTGIAPAMKKAKPRGKPSPLTNGSFELNGGVATSLLDGWTVVDIGPGGGPTPGSWLVQTGDAAPITGFSVPSPTDGAFAAMADQFGPGAHILYQDVVVPRGRPILSFDLYLGNQAGEYFSPETLSPDEFPNQQFRVDIMDPSAPVDDVGSGVLRNVYRTQPGDPAFAPYQTIQASLKEFAGRTVRLRFAEVDNQFFFEVGIDRVVVGKKPRKVHEPKHAGRATAQAISFAPESGPLANSVLLGDDETTGPLPIGFEFAFFGNRYTTVKVSSNGFIGFDADMSHGCCSGGVLPSDDGVNNLIALAWTDLYPPGGGQIAYETRGSAPNRRLIISYTAVPWCCEAGVDRVTSQVILYERRSAIEIHTTHQDAGHIYTQGVENADGTAAAFLSGRAAADYGLVNDAVRFATK
jgi:hypothetical protein